MAKTKVFNNKRYEYGGTWTRKVDALKDARHVRQAGRQARISHQGGQYIVWIGATYTSK